MNEPAPAEPSTAARLFRAVLVLCVGAGVGYFVYATTVDTSSRYPFKLGLDLAGGSHLVYEADTSDVEPIEVPELMNILKEVIERRVNTFGVSEPIVQVEQSSFVAGEARHRLVVELPGITDVDEAVREIGRTPLLEFKLVDPSSLVGIEGIETNGATTTVATSTGGVSYIDTGLTGRYFEEAQLVTQGPLSETAIQIHFNSEGAALFEQLTSEHTGEFLAILLDGEELSAPRINEPISGGTAVITSSSFQGADGQRAALALVQNLNFGALPLPIELASTQTIGASLGAEILDKGIAAGAIGFALVIAFMVLWYRLPGVIAVVALLIYGAFMLALFKLIPVTLTAAGLAGFILSLGMAVDANVLVFERMKEEYRSGKGAREAAYTGFARAWSAIRDGNMTSILAAAILFWLGTSLVKGFALVFGVGVLVSMLTALIVTRTLLLALPDAKQEEKTLLARLFGSGFHT